MTSCLMSCIRPFESVCSRFKWSLMAPSERHLVRVQRCFRALAGALLIWRDHTLYCQDDDWVFASPFTNGKRPYWPESALKDHIKPAAIAAGITKGVTWHTFRHSLASILGQQGEGVKTVQELLRHATSRVTLDVYQQGSTEAKRLALNRIAGIFTLPRL
jgi:site-specific recombinase XerD